MKSMQPLRKIYDHHAQRALIEYKDPTYAQPLSYGPISRKTAPLALPAVNLLA